MWWRQWFFTQGGSDDRPSKPETKCVNHFYQMLVSQLTWSHRIKNIGKNKSTEALRTRATIKIMTSDINMFGCYVSIVNGRFDVDHATNKKLADQGNRFPEYIWGLNGIDTQFKHLKHSDYGNDLKFVLFQFYVNPDEPAIKSLAKKHIYSKTQKAAAIPIIIIGDIFFKKNETEKITYLKQLITTKMQLLREIIKKKKLDTKLDLLELDLSKAFER